MADVSVWARRAVACPRFRWLSGMLAAHPRGPRRIDDQRGDLDMHRGEHVPRWLTEAVPDLTDAATVGCLFALVQDAWGQGDAPPDIYGLHYHCDGGWVVEVYDRHFYGATAAAALVAALEGAP